MREGMTIGRSGATLDDKDSNPPSRSAGHGGPGGGVMIEEAGEWAAAPRPRAGGPFAACTPQVRAPPHYRHSRRGFG